jgi:hypothetical protein
MRNTPKHLITQQAFPCPVRHPCSSRVNFARSVGCLTPASQSSRQNEVDHHVVAVCRSRGANIIRRAKERQRQCTPTSDEPISRAPCKRDRLTRKKIPATHVLGQNIIFFAAYRSGPTHECIPASQRSYYSSRSPHAHAYSIPPHAQSLQRLTLARCT